MKKLPVVIFLFFLQTEWITAQVPGAMNSSEILLGMKKLRVLGSVLYIAAHPDDENTRLLAWLSKEKLYKTGYLSLTRGDGGQNLIGDEQGIELGLIRTEELLAARKVDGADQFFTRAYDFGFSKTTEESLRFWDEKKILSDVVWIIRKFQPDIIITRFPEDKRAGHGQHSASSVLAHLAFTAAADPKQFQEQFVFGVHPWQARRLFWNNYNFGSVNTTNEDQLKIEVGGFNPFMGKSYGEIAAESRSQHRSQGFGIARSRGNSLEYFSLTEGEKADSSLMQLVDCTWGRVKGGVAIDRIINKLIKHYNLSAPYQSLKELLNLYSKMADLPAGYWRDEKMNETMELIQGCSGLWLEATVQQGYVQRFQNIPVTIRVLNRTPVSTVLQSVRLNQQDSNWNQVMQPGVNYSILFPFALGDLPISQPYWIEKPMSPGSYNVVDQTLIGRPGNPPELEAVFTVRILGKIFTFRQPVIYKYTDAIKGESYQPLTIVPPEMAYCDPDLLVFNLGNEKELEVRQQMKTPEIKGLGKSAFHQTLLSTEINQSFSGHAISMTPISGFQINHGQLSSNSYNYLLKSGEGKDQSTSTWATRLYNGQTDTLTFCKTINYDHIPRIDYFKQAKSAIVSVNLKISGKRIGYIDGAGDRVPDALSAMGYSVVKLNESNMTVTELQNLDAIIAGVRAYDVHDWLSGKYTLLMNYINSGGNLIVQYNRNRGNDSTGLGPYPFIITNTRITEEDASVRFILPNHPILHYPNEITNGDFEGWIQERGIYFAARTDSRYQSIFSMHDSGEPDQTGSLITGTYGKGNFTYTGLVFFRELPAGIPGAYRLLANIIALNQNRH